MRMIISLIGYRGTGKSTIGYLLSQRIGWPWVDTDQRIEQDAGCSIAELFANYGEPRFRQWEREAIAQLTRGHKQILALGGGAILDADNRRAISAAGPVVWLTADPATIAHRMAADPLTESRRPQLTTGGLDEIIALLHARRPLYEQCADLTIDTARLSPPEIVDEIVRQLDLTDEKSAHA